VTVQNSQIESDVVGVHFDNGTVNSTVKSTEFLGQSAAAIDNYLQGTPNNLGDTTGNDYSKIQPGAVTISTANGGNFPGWNT
jgi:hypothetical protein